MYIFIKNFLIEKRKEFSILDKKIFLIKNQFMCKIKIKILKRSNLERQIVVYLLIE